MGSYYITDGVVHAATQRVLVAGAIPQPCSELAVLVIEPESAVVADDAPRAVPLGSVTVRAMPNPFHGSTILSWDAGVEAASGGG